jgi:hypothetical protein
MGNERQLSVTTDEKQKSNASGGGGTKARKQRWRSDDDKARTSESGRKQSRKGETSDESNAG